MDKIEYVVIIGAITALSYLSQPKQKPKEQILEQRVEDMCIILSKMFTEIQPIEPYQFERLTSVSDNMRPNEEFDFMDNSGNLSEENSFKSYCTVLLEIIEGIQSDIYMETGFHLDRLTGDLKTLAQLTFIGLRRDGNFKTAGNQIFTYISLTSDEFCAGVDLPRIPMPMKQARDKRQEDQSVFGPILIKNERKYFKDIQCYMMVDKAYAEELADYPDLLYPAFIRLYFDKELLSVLTGIPKILFPKTFSVSCYNKAIKNIVDIGIEDRIDYITIAKLDLKDACSISNCTVLASRCPTRNSFKSKAMSTYRSAVSSLFRPNTAFTIADAEEYSAGVYQSTLNFVDTYISKLHRKF